MDTAVKSQNGIFTHGLASQRDVMSNKMKSLVEVHESLYAFFEELKGEGDPFVMWSIREQAGLTTRDNNSNEVCQPPHMSRHRVYAHWCWSRD